MINASIQAKMMDSLAYGDAAILSGDVNDLLTSSPVTRLSSLSYSLTTSISVSIQYLYKYMLEREEKSSILPSKPTTKYSPPLDPPLPVYRKMGWSCRPRYQGDEANQIEALFEYALDTNSHLYRVNSTIWTLPSGTSGGVLSAEARLMRSGC